MLVPEKWKNSSAVPVMPTPLISPMPASLKKSGSRSLGTAFWTPTSTQAEEKYPTEEEKPTLGESAAAEAFSQT
jgi:hypothetical protein